MSAFESQRSRVQVVLALVMCACRPEPAQAPETTAVTEPEPEPEPAPVEGAEPVDAPVAPAPAPVSYELDGNRLKLPGPIVFAAGQAEFAGPSEVALVHIRGYLAAKEYITRMRIEAHVAGPDAQALSERRALAVARWLVGQGIDCKRLIPVGFGDNKPIADGSTAEGRAANTRVEAHNAALRGRLIGGMPEDGGGVVAGDPCA